MNAQRIETELTDKEFIKILNEMYEPVTICGYPMNQGDILYECDITAFNEIKINYEDSMNKDNPIWECGECGEQYNDECAAEECCTEEDMESRYW